MAWLRALRVILPKPLGLSPIFVFVFLVVGIALARAKRCAGQNLKSIQRIGQRSFG
jgi:hypothetical protein